MSRKQRRVNEKKRQQSEVRSLPPAQKQSDISLTRGAFLFLLGVVLTCFTLTTVDGLRLSSESPAPTAAASRNDSCRTVWQLLALPDDELEQVDIVELNLAVAREIPGKENLDITKYQRIVNQWTGEIKSRIPANQQAFYRTPNEWQNDIRFFRLTQVAGYLNEVADIDYIEDQKKVTEIRYTDPADLFLDGLIDEREGTCGNMPALHVAICRRLGWPVSLASVAAHSVCRYDDGEVVYNIETTDTDHGGMVAAATDEQLLTRFNLPPRATTQGSDLKRMTARQMLGFFISLRARHFADTDRTDLADRDYALARSLIPDHRRTYMASMDAALKTGHRLFELREVGHPLGLSQHLNRVFARESSDNGNNSIASFSGIDDIERMNQVNRANQQRLMRSFTDPAAIGQPQESGFARQPYDVQGPPGWGQK